MSGWGVVALVFGIAFVVGAVVVAVLAQLHGPGFTFELRRTRARRLAQQQMSEPER